PAAAAFWAGRAGGAPSPTSPHIFPRFPPLAGRGGTATMFAMFASKKKGVEPDQKSARPTDGAGTKRRARAGKGPSMEKWLCWGTMGVAGVLFLLFLLDLLARVPFGGLSRIVDILALLACGAVFYLGWDA